jgi:hypothetical protein
MSDVSASNSVQKFIMLKKSGMVVSVSPQPLDAFGGHHRILVFPNSDDYPSGFSKGRVVTTVTSNIRSELGAPPIGIRLRSHRMLWATMPKTAVNEDSDLGSGENNVWSPRNGWNIDPVSKPTSVQFLSQCQFRTRPRRSEVRHESTHRLARRLRFSGTIRLGSHG